MGRELEVDLLLETGGGGAGRHVLDLYHGLRGAGWDVRLILSSRRADRNFSAEVAEIPRERVIFLDVRRSPHISDIPAVVRLKRYLTSSGRRHLIHAHSTKAGMLGWALRNAASTVFTPHTYRSMDPTLNPAAAVVLRRVESAFSRSYRKIIAVSPDEEKYVPSLGVSRDRVSYIPNGVNAAAIRARIANADPLEKIRTAPVVGFVGRLVYAKNPMLFLEAFRSVVERGVAARALIVGDGPLRPGLLEAATRYNLSHLIEWRGEVPGVEELGRMDVVVHTSRYEGCPYTLLEAAAAPVPIVAVENAGSRAILQDLLPGAIVGSSTPDDLAGTIISLLGDGPARASHLAALADISRRFTIENMVRMTVTVYEEVLDRSSRACDLDPLPEPVLRA